MCGEWAEGRTTKRSCKTTGPASCTGHRQTVCRRSSAINQPVCPVLEGGKPWSKLCAACAALAAAAACCPAASTSPQGAAKKTLLAPAAPCVSSGAAAEDPCCWAGWLPVAAGAASSVVGSLAASSKLLSAARRACSRTAAVSARCRCSVSCCCRFCGSFSWPAQLVGGCTVRCPKTPPAACVSPRASWHG